MKHRTVRHYNEPGHAHLLTFSCFRRLPLLSRHRTRQWCVEAINTSCVRHSFAVLAWVLMPDHVHLLVHPKSDSYSVAKLLGSIKVSVARRAIQFLKRRQSPFLSKLRHAEPSGQTTYRFWQPGPGHDLNLWDAERIWGKIAYIHANPVRKQLCERPEDWRYSSAAAFAELGQSLVTLDLERLPRLGC